MDSMYLDGAHKLHAVPFVVLFYVFMAHLSVTAFSHANESTVVRDLSVHLSHSPFRDLARSPCADQRIDGSRQPRRQHAKAMNLGRQGGEVFEH